MFVGVDIYVGLLVDTVICIVSRNCHQHHHIHNIIIIIIIISNVTIITIIIIIIIIIDLTTTIIIIIIISSLSINKNRHVIIVILASIISTNILMLIIVVIIIISSISTRSIISSGTSSTVMCVLRMDHYCPWLNNTVGYANHKFFLQFLVYSSSACLLGSIKTVPVAGFFLRTTIEFCEYRFSPDRERRSSRHRLLESAMYDVGLYNNLASVLGGNPLLWLLPVGAPLGDGLLPHLRLNLGSFMNQSSGWFLVRYASDWMADADPRTVEPQTDTAEGDLAGAVLCGCTMVSWLALGWLSPDSDMRCSRAWQSMSGKRGRRYQGFKHEESSMEDIDGYSSDGSEQSILSDFTALAVACPDSNLPQLAKLRRQGLVTSFANGEGPSSEGAMDLRRCFREFL
ncbi:Palmitoyltransferase ZDHHC15 [Symbiodinium microadriaticum]|uniref:Palmitoyltransferase n=1 Tax=Symbiodinium microadriaticum TaxID=2951 RepID=A0A1Q9EQM9_SYMMI|nr:Palmitoyltransferase ZDHHC15 [Symbiodinium microadriaticum]